MLERERVIEKGLPAAPALGRNRQLLVVDDDRAIQTLLSRTLSLMGYDVNLAGNGLEAMCLLLAGSYDLVITDFKMPLMDGLELSRLVKKQSANTPVLVITGCYDEAVFEKLTLSGADAIVLKPFELKEIGKTVQGLLESGA